MQFIQKDKGRMYIILGGIVVVILVSVILAVVLFVIDRNSDNSSSLALQEYIQGCVELDEAGSQLFNIAQQNITYGELVTNLEKLNEDYEKLSPPSDLEAFHDTTLEINAYILDIYREEDQTAPLSDQDDWVTKLAEYSVTSGPQFTAVFQDIPIAIQEELRSSGCVD